MNTILYRVYIRTTLHLPPDFQNYFSILVWKNHFLSSGRNCNLESTTCIVAKKKLIKLHTFFLCYNNDNTNINISLILRNYNITENYLVPGLVMLNYYT